MTVSFFGHAEVIDDKSVENAVLCTLEKELNGVYAEFLVGAHGKFDYLARVSCVNYKNKYKNGKVIFVTPYIDKVYLENCDSVIAACDETIYPDIESVPKRLAIVERNRRVVDMSDLIICYINRTWGGAFKAIEYAHKRKKKIINLGSADLEEYFLTVIA